MSRLEGLITSLGEPSYRAKQISQWVYQRLANSFEEMTDLPQAVRQRLSRGFRVHSLEMVHEATSRDKTVKALFALSDGKTIEASLMSSPHGRGHRHTTCLSTQVGCAIGCPFCTSPWLPRLSP